MQWFSYELIKSYFICGYGHWFGLSKVNVKVKIGGLHRIYNSWVSLVLKD